ncbi:hypothetical protein JB92DRAFT_1495761 [Gautieria morchelliformis]|nr:hypothetical protein JB92DRAFT_1495761 [Gautieria morchelliformis]
MGQIKYRVGFICRHLQRAVLWQCRCQDAFILALWWPCSIQASGHPHTYFWNTIMRGTLDLVAIIVGIALSIYIFPCQTTNATCITDFWTYNQEQQSPCLVAAALQSACNGGKWSVPALASDQAYGGPKMGESSPCQCSTVVYSVFSACAACQGALVNPWTDWMTNCSASDISISRFPLSLPSGFTVPAWAYLNVTASGTWSANASLISHDSGIPDGSGTATSTTASSTSTSITSATHSSTKSLNPGTIIGPVVSGVLGSLGYVLYRKKIRGKCASSSSAGLGAGRNP